MPDIKFERSRIFVRNEFSPKKKSCRLTSKQFLQFKEKLGLNPCKINFVLMLIL